jgi:hypothetical protein
MAPGLGESQKSSRTISDTSPKDLRETVAPNRRAQLRPHAAPHGSSTNRLMRSGDPAASRALAASGADACREPGARRRGTPGTAFNRTPRDWPMESMHADLPQASSGNHLQKEYHRTHGVTLGRVPRLSVGASRGLANDPRLTCARSAHRRRGASPVHTALIEGRGMTNPAHA